MARAASRFGDEVALVALTLRLQASGGRPYEVAALLAAGLIPFVVLAPIVGRAVDSIDSRRVLVISTLVQGVGCVPLIFVDRVVPMILLAALLGVGGAFSGTAWLALIPRVVGEEHIARATAVSQSGFTIALIGAPAAGGLLSAVFGTGVPLALDAASFFFMALAALFIRTRRRVDRSEEPSRFREGWRLIRHDPLIGYLLAGLAAFVLLGMMVNVVQVFLVRQTLHASATWYGALEALWMLGIVVGSLIAGKVPTDLARARATVIGAGVMSLSFIAFGLTPVVVLLAPAAIVGGVGNGVVNVCVSTVIITRTEDGLRGRVSAAVGAVVNAASVLSLVAGGALAEVLGPRQLYLMAGGLCAAVTSVLVARFAGVWRQSPSVSLGEPRHSEG